MDLQGGRSTTKRDDRGHREGVVPRAAGATDARDGGGEAQVRALPARVLLPPADVSRRNAVVAFLRAALQAHDEADHRHKPKVCVCLCVCVVKSHEAVIFRSAVHWSN